MGTMMMGVSRVRCDDGHVRAGGDGDTSMLLETVSQMGRCNGRDDNSDSDDTN